MFSRQSGVVGRERGGTPLGLPHFFRADLGLVTTMIVFKILSQASANVHNIYNCSLTGSVSAMILILVIFAISYGLGPCSRQKLL